MDVQACNCFVKNSPGFDKEKTFIVNVQTPLSALILVRKRCHRCSLLNSCRLPVQIIPRQLATTGRRSLITWGVDTWGCRDGEDSTKEKEGITCCRMLPPDVALQRRQTRFDPGANRLRQRPKQTSPHQHNDIPYVLQQGSLDTIDKTYCFSKHWRLLAFQQQFNSFFGKRTQESWLKTDTRSDMPWLLLQGVWLQRALSSFKPALSIPAWG